VVVILCLKVKTPFYILHQDSHCYEIEASVFAILCFILLGRYCDKNDREVKFVPYVFKHSEYLSDVLVFIAKLKMPQRIRRRLQLPLYHCFLMLINY
jgi:hypothetical protein